MNTMDFFYVGGMMFLSLGNSVQIGKGLRKSFLSWVQVGIYTITLVWYFVSRTQTGLTSEFFFFTSLLFIVSLLLETVEVTKKGRPSPLDVLVFVLSAIPVIFSLGIVTGMF